MFSASVSAIEQRLSEDALVLDVGSWGKPFVRADWVLDVNPWETRGLLGHQGRGDERFTRETWVMRDICARDPWPFEDDQFDFAICSHTLEDVRDPVWVCSELARVARAGYIEVPSRIEEQTRGVQGDLVGWGHHHWLIDVGPDEIEFAFKHQVIHGRPEAQFPYEFYATLPAEERIQTLWWEGSFEGRERFLMST
jgi:hypothetical protein